MASITSLSSSPALPKPNHATWRQKYKIALNQLSQNEVLSRGFIDVFGLGLSQAIGNYLMGRSSALIAEQLVGPIWFLLSGLIVPNAILEPLFSRGLAGKYRRDFGITNPRPLDTRFADLTPDRLEDPQHRQWLTDHFGLASTHRVREVSQAVMRGKFAIMAFDLPVMMFFTAQTLFRVRNWLTATLTGKDGYSGEMNEATDEYREQEAQKYEGSQNLRELLSVASGIGGTGGVVLGLYLLLNNRIPQGRGRIGKIKQWVLPKIEYTKGIYMPKTLLAAHTFFNYNLNMVFWFARSLNESLAGLAQAVTFDTLFYGGDALIKSAQARHAQRRHRDSLTDVSVTKPGALGLICGKPLHEIEAELQTKPWIDANQRELALQIGRRGLVAGLVGTSVLMGLSISGLSKVLTQYRVAEAGASRSDREAEQS